MAATVVILVVAVLAWAAFMLAERKTARGGDDR